MSSNIFHVEEETRLKTYKLFEKTELTVNEDAVIIKEWLETQPHLPEILDDVRIKYFLLRNKFSIEKTKQKIDMYYTVRSLIPDFFDNMNPKSSIMQDVSKKICFCIHPKIIDGLHRVFFIKTNGPSQFPVKDFILHALNVAEVRMCEDGLSSEVVFFDMANISLSDVKRITPTLTAKIFFIYQNVYSMRLKSLYIINSPSYVTIVTSILKTTMKPKLFERVQFFEDANILKQFFSVDELPKDYGGEGPSLQQLNDLVKEKLTFHQDRFDQLDKLRVNESLRPEKLNNDEVLGFYGSFKKLNVD
jgi:hypothetical protein